MGEPRTPVPSTFELQGTTELLVAQLSTDVNCKTVHSISGRDTARVAHYSIYYDEFDSRTPTTQTYF